MDVQGPIVLECPVALEDIVDQDSRSAAGPYDFTPLDFVSRREWIGTRLWAYYVNLLKKMMLIHVFQKSLPVRRISSFNFPPPDRPMLFFLLAISSAYAGIFVAGWNLHFPTNTEQMLWRVCTVGTAIIVFTGGFFEVFLILDEYRQQRRSYHTSAEAYIEMEDMPPPIRTQPLPKSPKTRVEFVLQQVRNVTPNKDPHYDVPIRFLLFTTPICAIYCIFRAFILVEDAISLRELPASAFAAIAWSTYLPHL